MINQQQARHRRLPPRRVVTCRQNPYKSVLFSYDRQGIYVKCKDCRRENPYTHEVKRGVNHLITWVEIDHLRATLGGESIYDYVDITPGRGPENYNRQDEVERTTGSDGGGGGEGGRLAGGGVSLSGDESSDTDDGTSTG